LFKGPLARKREAEHSDRWGAEAQTKPYLVLRDTLNLRWTPSSSGGDETGRIEGWGCEEKVDTFLPEAEVIIHDSDLVWVNAYLIDRAFGGPEEGGWWYDTGHLLASVCAHQREADEWVARLTEDHADADGPYPIDSVLSQGKLLVVVEDFPGQSYPEVRPGYS
jgi:hypothetical protein